MYLSDVTTCYLKYSKLLHQDSIVKHQKPVMDAIFVDVFDYSCRQVRLILLVDIIGLDGYY